MKNLFYTTLILLVGLTSCRSLEKMVDEGRYDDAIYHATQKLAGKKNKKTKHIQALEEAFFKVNSIETDRIAFLLSKDDPSAWDEIYELYKKIEWRQNRINGFLPLISKDGYVADFQFTETGNAQEIAKNNALAYHYQNATTLLKNAVELDDKLIAREAFATFEYLDKYDSNYKDANTLKNQTYELGINHVLVKWDESIINLTPNLFYANDRLPEHRNMWTIFHNDFPNGIELDAVSTIYLSDVFISPERETVNNIIERRQIESLVDKVDRRGSVVRDTAGQVIQEIQIENIEARIREIIRTKEMNMRGYVETIDYATGLKIDTDSWETTVNFASDACTFTGDNRALGDDTRKRVNQYLEPFPTDYEMIEVALGEVTDDIYGHLRNINFNKYLSGTYASNR